MYVHKSDAKVRLFFYSTKSFATFFFASELFIVFKNEPSPSQWGMWKDASTFHGLPAKRLYIGIPRVTGCANAFTTPPLCRHQ